MNHGPNSQPDLNLLLPKATFEEPLWKSLFRNIDDFLFPKKLPPLKLTSKPEPVRDIWGFYDYKRGGVMGSTMVHMVIVGLIIGGSILGRKVVQQVKKQEQVTLIAPDLTPDIPIKPAKTQVGGGGGGGDRDKFQAPKGKLPKFDMNPITPPQMVVRNEAPKLTAEPAVAVFGDPFRPQRHLHLFSRLQNSVVKEQIVREDDHLSAGRGFLHQPLRNRLHPRVIE